MATSTIPHKACARCHRLKSINEYSGNHSYCRHCLAEYQRAQNRKRRESRGLRVGVNRFAGQTHTAESRAKIACAVSASWTTEKKQSASELRKGKPSGTAGKRWNLARIKRCPSIKGVNNPNWKGGVTPEHQRIRISPEYKQWRRAVFKRDNWTCVFCGARSSAGNRVEIHADHIQPFAEFPELRLDVTNGRTLCKPCHLETPTYGVNRGLSHLASTCPNGESVAREAG